MGGGDVQNLTQRQKEILRLLLTGFDAKSAAQAAKVGKPVAESAKAAKIGLALAELSELILGEGSAAKKNKSLLGRLLDAGKKRPGKATASAATAG